MERSGKDLDHFMQEALREAGLKDGDEVKKTKINIFPKNISFFKKKLCLFM